MGDLRQATIALDVVTQGPEVEISVLDVVSWPEDIIATVRSSEPVGAASFTLVDIDLTRIPVGARTVDDRSFEVRVPTISGSGGTVTLEARITDLHGNVTTAYREIRLLAPNPFALKALSDSVYQLAVRQSPVFDLEAS